MTPHALTRYFLASTALLAASMLSGCASNSAATQPAQSGTGATTLYAINNSTTVLEYSLTGGSSATATPSATITMPTGFSASTLATDSTGNIYVAGLLTGTQAEILVFAAGSTGAATPTRTILGGSTSATTTTFYSGMGMQINSAGTLAMLSSTATGQSVVTFANVATANGAVTPTALIQGATTQLPTTGSTSNTGYSVAIDAAGKTYVGAQTGTTTSVFEYAAGATGNVAPVTTVTQAGYSPYGVAVDSSGNLYVGSTSSTGTTGTILVYASGASGAATPTRTITGTSTTLGTVGGIAVDGTGELFAVDRTSSAFLLVGFNSTANGNVAPTLSLTSAALNSPAAYIAVH